MEEAYARLPRALDGTGYFTAISGQLFHSLTTSGVLTRRFRLALDFRLMTGQRVAILDASHSIFTPESALPKGKAKAQNSPENGFLLQPIPGLKDMLEEVLKEDFASDVWMVDVGVMCRVDAVKRVGKALHHEVSSKVREIASGRLTGL